MQVVTLSLELEIPGCSSLKEKRGRLKPLLAQLHKRFNVSAAEVGHNDVHTLAFVACAVVSNDGRHAESLLEGILPWIETHRPDLTILDHRIERV